MLGLLTYSLYVPFSSFLVRAYFLTSNDFRLSRELAHLIRLLIYSSRSSPF